MGFGYLLFGFIVTAFGGLLPPVRVFAYAVGNILILFSLKKLILENIYFKITAVCSLVFELFYLFVLGAFALGFSASVTYGVLSFAEKQLGAFTVVWLLLAVKRLAKEVELPQISVKTLISLAFLLVHIVCFDLYYCIESEFAKSRLSTVSVFSQILYAVVTAVTIFECYAKICYEDDEEMKEENVKNTFFGFLTKKLNDFTEKQKEKGKKK